MNRGQQVNREAQRGRAQQQRAGASRGGGGAGGGGGGGAGRWRKAMSTIRSWRLPGACPVRRSVGGRDGAGAPAPQLRGFPTPEAAADAVTAAIRNNDDKAMTAILGSTWHEFAPGGDRDDDEIRAAYLKAWDEKHAIIPEGPDKALFGAGSTGWVAPIPIVKQGNEWRYDVEAGRKEMQARLIGRNELAVIQTLLAIVDAQRDYAAPRPMKIGLPVYARRLLSSPGRNERALLGDQAGRAGKPARPAGRQGAARRDPAARLLRLSLPPALQPGPRGARAAPTTTWSTAA